MPKRCNFIAPLALIQQFLIALFFLILEQCVLLAKKDKRKRNSDVAENKVSTILDNLDEFCIPILSFPTIKSGRKKSRFRPSQ